MERLEKNPYSWVRGVNYIPSYALILNDVMDYYDHDIIEKELTLAHEAGFNSVRMWFSDISYLRDPLRFLNNFEDLLCILNRYSMTIMPTLFNRFTDERYHFGQLDMTQVLRKLDSVKSQYIYSFLQAFGRDPTIIMWDL